MKRAILGIVCCLTILPLFAGEQLNIAMVLWRGETEAEQGFIDGLRLHGYQPQINIYNAERDRVKLLRHLKNRVKPRIYDYHYIYTFGTTVSSLTKQILKGRRPQIFNVVSDPQRANLLNKKNIAGVSNKVDMLQLFGQALQLYPSPRIGVLYNPQERNSLSQVKEAKIVADIVVIVDSRFNPIFKMS